MPNRTLILALLLVLVCHGQDFDAYVARFHKVYADADERARR